MFAKSLQQLSTAELRGECTSRGLSISGSKSDVIIRLEEFIRESGQDLANIRFNLVQPASNTLSDGTGEQPYVTSTMVGTDASWVAVQPPMANTAWPGTWPSTSGHDKAQPTSGTNVPSVDVFKTAAAQLQMLQQTPPQNRNINAFEARLSALEASMATFMTEMRSVVTHTREYDQSGRSNTDGAGNTLPGASYAVRTDNQHVVVLNTHGDMTGRTGNVSTYTPFELRTRELSVLIPNDELQIARNSLTEFDGLDTDDPVWFIDNTESVLEPTRLISAGWWRAVEPQLKRETREQILHAINTAPANNVQRTPPRRRRMNKRLAVAKPNRDTPQPPPPQHRSKNNILAIHLMTRCRGRANTVGNSIGTVGIHTDYPGRETAGESTGTSPSHRLTTSPHPSTHIIESEIRNMDKHCKGNMSDSEICSKYKNVLKTTFNEIAVQRHQIYESIGRYLSSDTTIGEFTTRRSIRLKRGLVNIIGTAMKTLFGVCDEECAEETLTDRRDVLMISTKHLNMMEEVMAKRGIKIKPKVVIDYNRGKGYIDLTDQMGSYSSCLRRGMKWYRKVAMDIICNTSLLNAFSIYKGVTGNSKTITQFKDEIINGLIQQSNSVPEVPELYDEHKLVNNKKRGRCNQCYKYISRTE
ncbi:piggyBac transposable element-derived protein 4-like, partial [Aphis craccivora]